MRIYFEQGDRVSISGDPVLLNEKLKDYFQDEKGRNKAPTIRR